MEKIKIILVLFIAYASADYWGRRRAIFKRERAARVGHQIYLTWKEETVNTFLMSAKQKEMELGFISPSLFPPAMNFFLAKNIIEQSTVFKFIQKMPKGAALHVHGNGIASVDYVVKNLTYRENLFMCQKENMKLKFAASPPADQCWKSVKELRKNDPNNFDNFLKSKLSLVRLTPDELFLNINDVWKRFQGIFDFQHDLLKYHPVYEDYLYKGLEEFYEDNVKYLEIRGTFSSVYELDGRTLKPEEVMQILRNVNEKFKKAHPDFFGIRFIYSPCRKMLGLSIEEHYKLFKKLKRQFPDVLVGFDLVGQEDLGQPLVNFVHILYKFPSEEGIKFFFHAGETKWNGFPSDINLVDAVLLNTSRIGNGFAVPKHAAVLEEIKKRKIAIEICPISHQVLKLVKDLRNHPAAYLLANDYPVVISSDNPSLWGASGLSYDYYETFMGLASKAADLRMLKQLAINSITYSGLPQREKDSLRFKFTYQWNEFIRSFHSTITNR